VASLYRAYAPSVFRICRRYVRDTSDAEDLTQAAFARIVRQWDSFRGESAAFTWIYRIAVNESLQFLRKEKGKREALPLVEEDYAMDAGRDGDGGLHLRLSVRRILERLPAELQEIAALHYLEGLSQQETAEALGLSLRKVEYKLGEFREQARKWMEEP
jgi:RNA polymerase sigma factor (sigma-70 family)